jgi:hypothetical protein
MPQQRHIAGRFAARKYNIRIQELSHEDVLRLLLDLMIIYGECAANLPGNRSFKANDTPAFARFLNPAQGQRRPVPGFVEPIWRSAVVKV